MTDFIIREKAVWRPEWRILRFKPMNGLIAEKVRDYYFKGIRGFLPFNVSVIPGNILLNAGIGSMWDLICGLGTPTAFSAANARIGVGDSNTAEAATQTGLQAAVNKAFVAMDATFPSRTNQTLTFQSSFDGNTANYAWNEFIVDNGGTALIAMNRKVSAQGTKTAGQVWTVQVAITLS